MKARVGIAVFAGGASAGVAVGGIYLAQAHSKKRLAPTTTEYKTDLDNLATLNTQSTLHTIRRGDSHGITLILRLAIPNAPMEHGIGRGDRRYQYKSFPFIVNDQSFQSRLDLGSLVSTA